MTKEPKHINWDDVDDVGSEPIVALMEWGKPKCRITKDWLWALAFAPLVLFGLRRKDR